MQAFVQCFWPSHKLRRFCGLEYWLQFIPRRVPLSLEDVFLIVLSYKSNRVGRIFFTHNTSLLVCS